MTELTPREWEILDLKCQGLTTKDISEVLGIAEVTVQVHASNIIHKVGARSLLHAAAILRLGYGGSSPLLG